MMLRIILLTLLSVLFSVLGIRVTDAQSEMLTAEEILAMRPFTPLDLQLHSPRSYAGTFVTPPHWLVGGLPSEDEVRLLVEHYLKVEFPDDPDRQAEGLALFDSPVALEKTYFPEYAVLRAALVGLMGTVGEPAIDFILHATNDDGNPYIDGIAFIELDLDVPGRAMIDLDTNSIHIQINVRYAYINPFLLSSIIAHETGHLDLDRGGYEEGTMKAIESLVYLQQLVRHPELAQQGDELSRLLNTTALLRLNGGVGHQLGLFASNGGVPALPDSNKTYQGIWDLYLAMAEAELEGAALVDTPGNPLLDAFLSQIAGRPIEGAVFNQETLDLIDAAGNGPMTSLELVAVARVLRLDVPSCEQTIDCVPLSTPPLDMPCILTAETSVNLRGGPGTTFPQAGTLRPGETARADAIAYAEDDYGWYRMDEDHWVRWDIIEASYGCTLIPFVSPN